MIEATGPNAEQISYWNEISGPKWTAMSDVIDAQIAPIGRETMDRAEVRAGENVLDVGCGCGQTTLDLATRVGPGGRTIGIDLSTSMLEEARKQAARAGAHNVEFLNADAQIHSFDGSRFDLVYSRFGVMFFADPMAAFENLWRALRPGGRLAFVCWQDVKKNPWMFVPMAAIAPHVELPAPPRPGAPGPFSMADAARLRETLRSAGFSEIRCDSLERSLALAGGRDLDGTVDFAMQIGPAAAALREAPASAREAAMKSIREALTPYQSDRGIEMAAAAWLVSAERPH